MADGTDLDLLSLGLAGSVDMDMWCAIDATSMRSFRASIWVVMAATPLPPDSLKQFVLSTHPRGCVVVGSLLDRPETYFRGSPLSSAAIFGAELVSEFLGEVCEKGFRRA